jgi:hypothetical protein
MSRLVRFLALLISLTIFEVQTCHAQAVRSEAAAAEALIKEHKNAGIVGLAAGQLGCAYPILAEQIAKAVNDGDNLRVVPMLTQGSAGNVFNQVGKSRHLQAEAEDQPQGAGPLYCAAV